MSADFSDEQMRQFAKMSSVDEVDTALGNKEAIKIEREKEHAREVIERRIAIARGEASRQGN